MGSENFPLDVNSYSGGVVIITIPNPAADTTYGSSLACRSCLVMQKSGTQAYMNIGTAVTTGTMATTTDWKLSSTTPIPVPINDVNTLHFCGTAGDRIQIVWRN